MKNAVQDNVSKAPDSKTLRLYITGFCVFNFTEQ